MSMWTHLTGLIKIRDCGFYSDMENGAEQFKEEIAKKLKESGIPFGTEGPIKYGIKTSKDRDFHYIVFDGNLRDVGEETDMSESGLTSKFSYIKEWVASLPEKLEGHGTIEDFIFRYWDDDKRHNSRLAYTVENPDFLQPNVVITQELPHPNALRVS